MLFIIMAVMSSCSSDDDSGSNYIEENFFAGYLEATSFDEEVEVVELRNIFEGSEFGLDFTPKVKVKITALKVKLPAVSSTLRTAIWDKQILFLEQKL